MHAELYSAGLERVPLRNAPVEEATWAALESLATTILDPVVDALGPLRVTYGFASPDLVRSIRRRARQEARSPRICPRVDQHAGHELVAGARVCSRAGVAVDFEVPGVSSDAVASWLLARTPVDRIYLYGADRPLHVSWAPSPAGLAYLMAGVHPVPRLWKPDSYREPIR